MTRQKLLQVTAVLGACAVALGAFAAHGLKGLLAENKTAEVWHTAVFYHFIHVLAMLVAALREDVFRRAAWWFFLVGVLIFSGSLYILAITKIGWLGAVTPLGGVSLILGWLALALPLKPRDAKP
jgi:uncharacterized membrane protein YgdD (TMEM256/DUF423 family)